MSAQKSNSLPNSSSPKSKVKVRRKNKQSFDVSYKSLTDAVMRISETGYTSEHDQSLLDTANKRVIEELYDGNVHQMTTKQLKSSSTSPLRSEGSRRATRMNAGIALQMKVPVDHSPPIALDTDISDALQHMTTSSMNNNNNANPATNSNYNEIEIAELDQQFKNELLSAPKQPTVNRTNRNRASTEIRKRSFTTRHKKM